MKQYFVYILLCSDQSYYTGVTNNVDKRFAEHEAGIDPTCYTFKRRPLNLMCVERFLDVNQAIAREKQIKGWRRAKKEALINGDYESLPRLAKTAS